MRRLVGPRRRGGMGRVRSLDTTGEAEALQQEIQRGLGGPARLRLALHMSVAARSLTLARLRRRHPEYTDLDLRKALLRQVLAADDLPPPLR